ncbi:hypothetical protein AA313_de0209916 [Arthrobotrys entomopaga]|nr:hypothetical protein AA313_de0209916 [Arthrobotrys entomopaga]
MQALQNSQFFTPIISPLQPSQLHAKLLSSLPSETALAAPSEDSMFTKTELLAIIDTLQPSPSESQIVPIRSGGGVYSQKFVRDGLMGVIDEGNDGIVTVLKYCRENDLQLDFLKKLITYLHREWSVQVSWLDGERFIYSTTFHEDLLDKIKLELEVVEEPTEFGDVSLMKDSGYPTEFIQRLHTRILADKDLDGVWTGYTFIPASYQTKRREEALEMLRKDGYIASKTLKRGYVDNPTVFFTERGLSVTCLSSHYVTQDWMDGIQRAATKSLDTHGFANIKELAGKLTVEEQLQIKELVKTKQRRKLLEYGGGGHLVTKELVDELTRVGIVYAREEAERAWASAVEKGRTMLLSTTIPWRGLYDFLSIDHGEVPEPVLESISQAVLSKVSAKYVERVNELRDAANASAKLHFTDKVYLRFKIHLIAMNRVQDVGLQDKLAQDLLVYYQKILLDSLTKLLDRVFDNQSQRKNERIEESITTVGNLLNSDPQMKSIQVLRSIEEEFQSLMRVIEVGEPSEGILGSKKAEMQRELIGQLQKTSDISLMMLVVLILLFSGLEDGILRATGYAAAAAAVARLNPSPTPKYAPKILKQLRAKMTETDYEFLNSVKAAVIAKSTLSGEDIDRLRGLVD